jgi:hypothetical protein
MFPDADPHFFISEVILIKFIHIIITCKTSFVLKYIVNAV